MVTLRWSLLLALCFACACSLEPVVSGQRCTRSTQCKAGLACVYPSGDGTAAEGHCSADLTSLYDPNQVPMLGQDTPGSDAATPGDAGGAATGADAAPPDAG